jgi:Plant transposon protein
MPRSLFNKIHDRLMGKDPFVQKEDCTVKMGVHPLVKLTACLRFLAYGDAYDREDQNLRMGQSTLRQYVQQFAKLIITEFGPTYLNRAPTKEERESISWAMATRDFPGCIGSWDCKHFNWQNCPMRWAGQHQGHSKGGKKTLILEAIADHRRYF